MDQPTFVKEPAQKITIQEILEGTDITDSGSSLLLTKDNKKISRLNLIAFVVKKEKVGSITTFLLDDSTGTIILRSFEENKKVEEIILGDVLLILGKVRSYNGEKYISHEIMKKVDQRWLKVRLKEKDVTSNEKENSEIKKVKEESISENGFESGQETREEVLPSQKITKLIKELDQGNGVLIEEIIEKSPLTETEKILEKMLERGEIFQNLPGKVKVL